MSDTVKPEVGTIGWRDLTVENAGQIRDFYQAVVGWESEPVPMGEYDDFNMIAPGVGEGVAGICHARGTNAGFPSQWLIYINVEDIERSMAACKRQGGQVIVAPKSMGKARYCVIRDPAGAVCALFQPAPI